MNKLQLQEKAKSLGVAFDPEDTNKVLEVKITEKEDELAKANLEAEGGPVVNVQSEVAKPVGIITTASFDTSEPVVPDDTVEANSDDPEDEREKPVASAEPETPEPSDEETLLKYKGTSNTYQISKYRFSKNDPFQIVPKDFADKLGEDHIDLEPATKEDVEEFYSV